MNEETNPAVAGQVERRVVRATHEVSGADLLNMRSMAATADDYTTICRNNIDRLSQAYLALQVENVRLREALTELMKYTPRSRRVGGIDDWKEVPAGAALCAVLDKCEAALSTHNA